MTAMMVEELTRMRTAELRPAKSQQSIDGACERAHETFPSDATAAQIWCRLLGLHGCAPYASKLPRAGVESHRGDVIRR